jgi:putative Mn2+ efflux pump MntP
MWLTLVGLVVPLGLDTFAIAAALGMAGLNGRDRTRVTLVFTAFEVGMPLVGVFAGNLAGRAVGDAADYLAIAILIGLGLFMLRPQADDEEKQLNLLARTRGLAMLGLGISISIDELAIGFTIGLLHFPVLVILGLIGIQTFVLTQAGIRLGARIGERLREGAERVAGGVLVALGVVLLGERFFH